MANANSNCQARLPAGIRFGRATSGELELAERVEWWLSSGTVAGTLTRGYLLLEAFRLEGCMPVWRYHAAGQGVEMRVWMEPGAHTTCLASYRLVSAADSGSVPATLPVSLLVNARDHLRDAGLGTVSEIFDGAPPHRPRGCPSRAWSVACTLEAWWRLEQVKQNGSHHA